MNEHRTSNIEHYEPYGPEWEREMMRFSKKELIALLKDKFEKNKKIEFMQNQLIDINKGYFELKSALKKCITVLRSWHGPEAFEIYYDHSPEMAPIRTVLPGFRVKD